MEDTRINLGIRLLELEFGKNRVRAAIEIVKKFQVEIPSWVFGPFGGGRFGAYMPPGFARNIYEKLDDAAFINELTGATKKIATHVLWDFSEDGITGSYDLAGEVAGQAQKRGLGIGSVSPTYFLKGSFRGSLSSQEKATTADYINQTLLAEKIAKKLAVGLLTIWLPDGSNYPGQVELQKAINSTRKSLIEIANKIDKSVKVLIEYKVFEPGTYSTVLSDWGSAYLTAKNFGPNGGVLIDLGHHFPSTNIEQIVARLIDEGMFCGFHFNSRYAADDDHAVEPNAELARIFYELKTGRVVGNEDPQKNWPYMIDQCSSRENRMIGLLHSVDSLQNSLAKAALVDREMMAGYQSRDEIILANRFFNDALLNADVRPIVAAARLEKNLPVDPVSDYVKSGYQSKIENERD